MGNVDLRNEIAYKVGGKDGVRVFIGEPWEDLGKYKTVWCVDFKLDCVQAMKPSWMWALEYDAAADPPGITPLCSNSPCVPPQLRPTIIAIAPDVALEGAKAPVWYRPGSTDCQSLMKELASWCSTNDFRFVNLYRIGAKDLPNGGYLAAGLADKATEESIRELLDRFGGTGAVTAAEAATSRWFGNQKVSGKGH